MNICLPVIVFKMFTNNDKKPKKNHVDLTIDFVKNLNMLFNVKCLEISLKWSNILVRSFVRLYLHIYVVVCLNCLNIENINKQLFLFTCMYNYTYI